MRNLLVITLSFLFAATAHAGFLDKVNNTLKTIESANDTADRAERETKRIDRVPKTKRNKGDKELFSEWKEDLKVAEKGAQKSCKKKIRFEFDPIRFKGFLRASQSPGAMCGDIAKALEFDLCTENQFANKIKGKLDSVKCYYTSSSSDEIKMRFNDKELMVGFSENSKDLYEESLSWLQKNL